MGTIKSLLRNAGILMGVLIALQTVISFNQAEDVIQTVSALTEEDYPLVQRAHEMKLNVVQVQQWLTDISATRGLDGLDDGFSEAESNAKAFREISATVLQNYPDLTQEIEALVAAFEGYYKSGQKMARAYVARGPAGGNKMMGDFDAAAANLASQIDPFIVYAEERVLAGENRLRDNAELAEQMIVLFSSSYIVILAVLVLLFVKRIINPLNETLALTADLADGDRDLTKRLNENVPAELGQLSRNINTFVAGLHEGFQSLAVASESLSATSNQLVSSTEKTSIMMDKQQAETDSVAQAITEMSVTINEVANNAALAAASANQADEGAHNGKQVVQKTIDMINELAVEIGRSSEVIQAVEVHTEEIGQVSQVISDIADQTNLLALNAAIEAARAGEQGRGFAVVADEVRSLAQRTQESTGEINRIIERLQESAQQAVEVMQQGQHKVDAGVQQAVDAGVALDEITSEVTKINDMNGHIATAAEEQGIVSMSISDNVGNIQGVGINTTHEVTCLKQVGDELHRIVQELQQMVGQFRV